jgi:hypothetical protein
VQLIYELVLSGKSLIAVGLELEARKIPTPGQILEKRGQLPRERTCSPVWRRSTLRRILSNPAYIGKHSGWRHVKDEVRELDRITGEVKLINRAQELAADDPERVYFPNACPSLVSEASFAAVQTVLKRNRAQAARNIAEPNAVLLRNGFAICG